MRNRPYVDENIVAAYTPANRIVNGKVEPLSPNEVLSLLHELEEITQGASV